jgi:hypothetical protein
MEAGIDHWEASWCGLGRSPFADQAGGNLDIRKFIKVYKAYHLGHGFDEEAVRRIIYFLKKNTQRDISDVAL